MSDRLPDDTDRASALMDAERESLVAQVRAKVGLQELQPDGECHWCGDEVASPRLFCDGGCASEWDMARKRQTRR